MDTETQTQTQQTQTTQPPVKKRKKNENQTNIGIHEDTFTILQNVKMYIGYKSYTAIIETLLDEFGDVDLAKVHVGEREKGGYVYIAITKDLHHRLTQLQRKFKMTYDTILYKLLKLKGWAK